MGGSTARWLRKLAEEEKLEAGSLVGISGSYG